MNVDQEANSDITDEGWNRAVRNKLIKDGILPLIGPIEDGFLESFLAPLEYLTTTEDENIKAVNLIINSAGGDASWIGRAVYLISQSRRPVVAYIDEACSAAFMIAMACHIRFCYPTSILMHHRCYTEVGGSGKELSLQAHMVDALDEACDKVLYTRTLITKEILDKHRENNWWITPKEALKLKVVHEILHFDYCLNEVDFHTKNGELITINQIPPEPKAKAKAKAKAKPKPRGKRKPKR